MAYNNTPECQCNHSGSKFIVPLHLLNLTSATANPKTGYVKLYFKNYVLTSKRSNGTERNLVLDSVLSTLSIGVIAEPIVNTDTIVEAFSKLQSSITTLIGGSQSDWDESDITSLTYIQNKPTNLSDFTNDTGYITIADVPTDVNELTDVDGEKVPTGGTTDQVLAKIDGTSGNTYWKDESGTVTSVNGDTGDVVLTTGDIGVDTDSNYVSDAELVVIGNTSGTNSGDQEGDGVTITGAGTSSDPFVSIGGGGGGDSVQTLTFATTITPVLADGNIMTVVTTNDCTMNIPSDMVAGQLFKFYIDQDGTGGNVITWASGYGFQGNVIPIRTGTANSRDSVTFRAISTTEAVMEVYNYDI